MWPLPLLLSLLPWEISLGKEYPINRQDLWALCPGEVYAKQESKMNFKILSFSGHCFQKPKWIDQCMPSTLREEKQARVSDGSTREKKVILPVSRDGEGKVEKESLGLGRSGVPPWQSPGALIRKWLPFPPNLASKQQGRALGQWAIPWGEIPSRNWSLIPPRLPACRLRVNTTLV